MIKFIMSLFEKKECLHNVISYYDSNDNKTIYLCRKCGIGIGEKKHKDNA